MEMFVHSIATFPGHLLKNAGLPLLIQVVSSLIALLCSICPAVVATCVACGGATTLECMYPRKEYLELGPGDYFPLNSDFYARRYLLNVREVLGNNWWLRLLVPVRGRGLSSTVTELRRGWSPSTELVQRVRH